jgi:hypothetical protein
MRGLQRCLRLWLVAGLVVFASETAAQPTRNRISILVDSSGSMLQTPQKLSFSQSCTGFNPCTFLGNPTVAQEACNPCVSDTIRRDSTCASAWDASCQTGYAQCRTALTGLAGCTAGLQAFSAVATRGDGSLELPGCDLSGDGIADDSALFQAKIAVHATAAAASGVEFALWRFRQVIGGQSCTSDPQCPDTPGGQSVLTCENVAGSDICAFDADLLDGPTMPGFEGQCSVFTHTGSRADFACVTCDSTTSYERAACEFFQLGRVRVGSVSPLNGTSTVACFPQPNPTHRFITYHGAVSNAGVCDPAGGDRLVDFPLTSASSNLSAIVEWLDHTQSVPAAPAELRANGGAPLAAMLRDLRSSLLTTLAADPNTPCRRYSAVLVVDGIDTCETNSAAVGAASALQDLSFTNPGGTLVSGFAVPVHVVAFGACPQGSPNCAAVAALDAVAAAGGTAGAFRVSTELELSLVLANLANVQDFDACTLGVFADGFELAP